MFLARAAKELGRPDLGAGLEVVRKAAAGGDVAVVRPEGATPKVVPWEAPKLNPPGPVSTLTTAAEGDVNDDVAEFFKEQE